MTVHVTICSGTTPGGEQPQMRAPHGEIVEEMTPTVKTAAIATTGVSVTTGVTVMTAVSVLTAVTKTVGMTVNPEVQLEVRRKVSQSSCLKLLCFEPGGGAVFLVIPTAEGLG